MDEPKRGASQLKSARIAIAAAFVLSAGVFVVRTAVASSDTLRPGYGEALYPAHPAVIAETVMASIGTAAARGDAPPPATLALLERLAIARPLAAEPFLVQGAIALRRGELARAEPMLAAARARAPRDPAARYLLADLYLRSGRPLPAMVEMSVLNRLLPQASLQLAPALAAYARTPGAARQLGAIVNAYPELAPPLLQQLASDAGNAELVLALADRAPAAASTGAWRRTLVEALVDERQFARAGDVWEQLTGEQLPVAGLFNPSFSSDAPPPFNWNLSNDANGLAGGRSGALELLYYGRADVDLAAQTLLLAPGRYRLGMTVSGDIGSPGTIRWTMRCLGTDQAILDLPLPAAGGARPAAGEFTVPAGCPAQQLRLSAVAPEFPDEAEFQLRDLRLEPVAGQ